MTHSRELPGFGLTITSSNGSLEEVSKEALAKAAFLKTIEGSVAMVMQEFDVTEETVCTWLVQAVEFTKLHLEDKKG